MSASKKQIKIVSRIDAEINKLRGYNCNDIDILCELSGNMPDVKKILDSASN